jgi:hypothetical protein
VLIACCWAVGDGNLANAGVATVVMPDLVGHCRAAKDPGGEEEVLRGKEGGER